MAGPGLIGIAIDKRNRTKNDSRRITTTRAFEWGFSKGQSVHW